MRTYEGLGGNTLLLDSKHIIARTQFIEESCAMSDIVDIAYKAPNLTKNGCITVTTANNVIPIYFVAKQAPTMVEGFGIVSAICKDRRVVPAKPAEVKRTKIGTLKCSQADHPFLRIKGRMNILLGDKDVRLEYMFTTQGCTIPLAAISKVYLADLKGSELHIDYELDGEQHSLVFTGRKCAQVWEALDSVLVQEQDSAPSSTMSATATLPGKGARQVCAL